MPITKANFKVGNTYRIKNQHITGNYKVTVISVDNEGIESMSWSFNVKPGSRYTYTYTSRGRWNFDTIASAKKI